MKKINTAFVCSNCGQHVLPAQSTCRNHCPYCLVSLHVDDTTPGDRKSSCHGHMFPIDFHRTPGVSKILFCCKVCGHQHRNKVANDDIVNNIYEKIKKYKREMMM